MPVLCAGVAVEGVHAVAGRGYVNYVVDSTSDVHGRDNQRLRINLVVHRIPEQQAKLACVHVRWHQRSLTEILPGPRRVVVLSNDVNLSGRA